MVRREGVRVRCFTRGGLDWADRFPAIVDAARCLKAKSFLIDGEAVVCRPDGLSDFDALRVGRRAHEVTLAAFDLIELHGDDLRDEPLSKRKQRLAKILDSGPDAIVYNEHLEHDGAAVFEHACRMGLEGIVSKRLNSPYRSGPSKTWLKSKNPLSVARSRSIRFRRADFSGRGGSTSSAAIVSLASSALSQSLSACTTSGCQYGSAQGMNRRISSSNLGRRGRRFGSRCLARHGQRLSDFIRRISASNFSQSMSPLRCRSISSLRLPSEVLNKPAGFVVIGLL